MKSLNDSLREEFADILTKPEIQEIIDRNSLDQNIIKHGFSILLANKTGGEITDLVTKGRAEFETYIINTLKSKKHDYQ